MKNKKLIATIVAIVLVIAFVKSFFFIVSEMEQVVVTQFGEPVGDTIKDAGLHFKPPWRVAHFFDKRILRWDGEPTQVVTMDKKYIFIDTTARWKIAEPLKFLQAVVNETGALSRLDDVIDSNIRNYLTRNNLIEIVRTTKGELKIILDEETKGDQQFKHEVIKIETGRDDIVKEILEKTKDRTLKEYGIELIDVRIKRINYIEEVREKVYERMISERVRIAEKYRSEGEGETARILGLKDKELKRITSGAYKKAKEIEGSADAQAIKIYARAYNNDPEFYSFLKTLESYKETFKDNSKVILSTNNEFFRYLKSR